MLIYQDLISGDALLSDSFDYDEIIYGILWSVQGKWVVQGDVKVVDIVDTFRLQEKPAFDKKGFIAYMKRYNKLLKPLVKEEAQANFMKNFEGATKYLLSKLSDFQFFVGESMTEDSSLVFAYYQEGVVEPTFIYIVPGLKAVKC